MITFAEDYVRTKKVSELMGVSERQLQWWDERGIVSPMIAGGWRCYSQNDIVMIGIIAELKRKGMTLVKVRKVIASVRRLAGKSGITSVKWLIAEYGSYGSLKVLLFSEAAEAAQMMFVCGVGRSPVYIVDVEKFARQAEMLWRKTRESSLKHKKPAA
jgi:DNA-binding transcriptional MerR regulator